MNYSTKNEAEKEAARAYAREYQREYRKRPEVRERFLGYIKKYKEKHVEELRQQALDKHYRNMADPTAKARIQANHRNSKVKLKLLLIEKYSDGKMACVLCGENRFPCLSIDHIDGGGSAHRKSLRVAGDGFYNWLRRNNFPDGFRVLCMNCQFISLHEMREKSYEL